MTVGEKIQYYRKKEGLSQEDLGQKLMVSRQTISLWEMDKTVPSIDNLMRLKEIFGISIDDILCSNEVEGQDGDSPLESYTFTITKDEAKQLFNYSARSLKRNLFIILILFAFAFCWSFKSYELITGIVVGAFLAMAASYIRTFITFNKTRKQGIERISQSRYTYNIFEYGFTITIEYKDKYTKHQIFKIEDIEKVFYTEQFIILQIKNELYSLKKAYLDGDSRFYRFIHSDPLTIARKQARNKWRPWSIVLFITSLLSILLALGTVAFVTTLNGYFLKNMWLFFMYLPIPIGSVLFYVLLKRKGVVFRKNLIVGIIMSALLCIYGCFVFFPEQMSVSEEYKASIEQILAEEYSDPDVIEIFSLEKADVHIETICVFQTADKGVVVGSLYKFEDENETYFQEFESDLQIGKRYYSEGCTCDYDIGYQIYTAREQAPDVAYALIPITVDGKQNYFCVGYIGYYMSDDTHWVTE